MIPIPVMPQMPSWPGTPPWQGGPQQGQAGASGQGPAQGVPVWLTQEFFTHLAKAMAEAQQNQQAPQQAGGQQPGEGPRRMSEVKQAGAVAPVMGVAAPFLPIGARERRYWFPGAGGR